MAGGSSPAGGVPSFFFLLRSIHARYLRKDVMATGRIRKVKGEILLIQEERFRLVGETGRGFLFTLSHKASVTVDHLELWYKERSRVIVEYEGEPNFESAVAHSVRPHN